MKATGRGPLPAAGGLVVPDSPMEDIASQLRETRERLGLTLDEVERATRIRVHYLEALESGDLEHLPSPVQARGFLKNYADFLGLHTEGILLAYAEALQARSGRKRRQAAIDQATTRPSIQVRSSRPRWLSADLFVAALITLGVIAVLLWGGSRVMASLRTQSEAAEEGSGLLIPTETPTMEATAEIDPGLTSPQPEQAGELPISTGTPTLPALVVSDSPIDLRVVAERRAWVQVVADGREIYQGRLTPGAFLELQAETQVELVTGNGAALRVFYNGVDQGLLGGLDEVVIRIWTPTGVVTPTPSNTPLPTETPTPSRTPRVSPTPGS